MKVVVQVGDTAWATSIFPDKESGSYLLPLKADVRKAERILEGATLRYRLTIER